MIFWEGVGEEEVCMFLLDFILFLFSFYLISFLKREKFLK